MAINSTSPTTFTSGVLITDTSNSSAGARGVINATITPSTALDVQSTEGAFCPPRMTTTQRDALTAANGMLIYNTTTNQMNIYQNGGWAAIESGADIDVVGQTRIVDDGLTGENIFVGRDAGLAIPGTANNNVALGSSSLNSLASTGITEGRNNVAIGPDALTALTIGSDCIAIGTDVLETATTALDCIGLGTNSLDSLTIGQKNIGIGSRTIATITTQSGNTALGFEAGTTQDSLTDCVFIGRNADATTNTLTNAIAIGAGATVAASNSMVLGSVATKIGIGNSSPAYSLHVTSAAQAVKVDGGYIAKLTVAAGTTYTALVTDYIIQSTNTNAVTITLPAGAPSNLGQIYLIKGSANAGTNNTTIAPASGTIDGAASVAITTNNGHIQVFSDGANWFTI
jgi:hypothetical protein